MPGLVPGIHFFFCGQDVDGRVKLGHDEAVDNWEQKGLTSVISIAISTPPGTSGLLAFAWGFANDGIDQIERRA
jgi:hypothetical protein